MLILMLLLEGAFASRSYGPILLGSDDDLSKVMPVRLHSDWKATEQKIPSAQNVSWILTSPFTVDDVHSLKMDSFLDETKNAVLLPSVLGDFSINDFDSNMREIKSLEEAFNMFRQEAALKKPVALMGWQGQSFETRQDDTEDKGRIDLCCLYLTTTDSDGKVSTVKYDPKPGTMPMDFTNGAVQIDFSSEDSSEVLTFRASFYKRPGLWYLNESSIATGNGNPIPLDFYACGAVSNMKTRLNYSCVCQSTEFEAKSGNISEGVSDLSVSIKNMRLQPFGFEGQFGRGNDCVCFLTVPMWMALFFILVFVFFVYFALSTISVIEGPTKFPDSQSKMISVPVESK